MSAEEKGSTGKTGSKENVLVFKKEDVGIGDNAARDEALIKLKHTKAFTLIYLDENNVPGSIYSHSGISHIASRGMVNFSERLHDKIEENLDKDCGL